MLRVALLGRYEVHLGDEPVGLNLRPMRLLLAYLLLHRDRRHQREQLAGVLWPGYTDASSRKNLRNTIYRLRKQIGDDYLEVDRASVAFNRAAGYWLDVEQLEQAALDGEIEGLLEAAETCQGELLPGFYEEWIVWERERLQLAFERLMAALLARLNEAGRWAESIAWSERWIAQGQAPEPAYRALMRAHAAQGDQAAVTQAYRRAAAALERVLDVSPAAETEQLYQTLLASTAGAEAVESGSASVPAEPGTHLPAQDASFIGQQREMAKLQQLLRQESNGRLLTILGPGGIGKTRLALEAGAAVGDAYADGVYFVGLAPVTDPQHVVSAIGDSIGFRYWGGDDVRQGLVTFLATKNLLLVLDNFEHLLPAADLVVNILHQAPGVRILCTSRERLNLSGETIYPLSGLDFPADPFMPVEALGQYGAVQLLLDRARLVRPDLAEGEVDLAPAARICQLVQGMPLALILAAGWLEMLTFREVAEEIERSLDILKGQARDLPERQRSVRAAFEYSWGRLTAEEGESFSRLAVFRGGFSRRAAQLVAGAGLRDLRALVERSLVTAERPDRYAVHELLRQFADEKLEAAGQAQTVRDSHSRYYLEALVAREADLKGRRQWEALEEIDTDLGNVRAAWDRAIEAGNGQDVGRALESIYLYLYIRSRYQDGWKMLQKALTWLLQANEGVSTEQTRLWARLASRAGVLRAQFATSAPEIERDIQRSLAIAEEQHDQTQVAHAYLALGHYHSKASYDFQQAAICFRESLDRYRVLGDDFFVAHLLHRVGYVVTSSEGLESFVSYTRQSMELARQIGDRADEANAVGNLGSGYLLIGDYVGADTYLRDALALDKRNGDRQGMATALSELGLLEFLRGRLDEAMEGAAHGYKLWREILGSSQEVYALGVLSLLATIGGNYEEGRRLAAESQTRMSNDFGNFLGSWSHAASLAGLGQSDEALAQAVAALDVGVSQRWYGIVTWTLPVLAIIYAQKDQPRQAAELLGLFFNHPMSALGWAEEWPLLSETQDGLEAALGRTEYKAAYERGNKLDLVATVEDLITR